MTSVGGGDESRVLQETLHAVHAECRRLGDGEVATYIPALAAVDPELFGLAICTADGRTFVVGDADRRFTLQSVCKPFLYAAALARHGPEHVHRYVGVEPIGERFDAFLRLDAGTHRPHNPMLNAGAITVAGLLDDGSNDVVVEALGAWAGGVPLEVDTETFTSEWMTNDRNRAIAHLLRQFDVIEGDVNRTLEAYTRACAVRVSAAQLAVMGGALAGWGAHPINGRQLLPPARVSGVLTLMMTCGMYDGAGRFAVDVGIPAKSGVSGGVLAVVPGRFAIAAYSPRLDAMGNSVRAVAALRQLSERLDLSVFAGRPAQPSAATTISAAVRSVVHAVPDEGEGAVAQYLVRAGAPAEGRALAVCTVHGTEAASGDTDSAFSLQAAANPFAYALALTRDPWPAVDAKVGVASSGNPFDAILLNPRNGRPYNPLNNAGAIAVASMAAEAEPTTAPETLAMRLSAFNGAGSLEVDPAVLDAERRNGHRNRAIAYLLRSLGLIGDVDRALEVYFQQCALRVTALDLARMGAVLAAGGRPAGARDAVVTAEAARRAIAVMYTCGLHDASGHFAYEIGIPAKSGLSGGLVAVVPGVMGVAVFGPRVDRQGTSVWGRAALRRLAVDLGLGRFAAPRTGD